MKRILFVCTTSLSRSPLFAAMCQKLARDQNAETLFEFLGRGSYAGATPRPVDRRMVATAEGAGINLSSFRTQQIGRNEAVAADLLVAIDEDSFWFLRREFPEVPPEKVHLVSEYGKDLGRREILEPAAGDTTFADVLEVATKICPGFVAQLVKEARIPR